MTAVQGQSREGSTSPAIGYVFVGLVCAAAIAATIACIRGGWTRLDAAVAFAALIAIGELLDVRLPGDRPTAPIASAAALGYAMVFDIGGQPVAQTTAQVVVVVAAGCTLGTLLRVVAGRRSRLTSVARRVVLAAVAAVAFRATAPHTTDHVAPVGVQGAIALGRVAHGRGGGTRVCGRRPDCGVCSCPRASRRLRLDAARRDQRYVSASRRCRRDWRADRTRDAVDAVVRVAGVLRAAVADPVRVPAVRRDPHDVSANDSIAFASDRGRRLRRVGPFRPSEPAGIAVGRELGLTENELLDLEYAALLHDIGQLSLIDPIPGGSTLVVAPVERRRVAELGADVIKTTGVLDRVAEIVARQADPYRKHRESPDDTLPIESRIIKAASAYDDLVGAEPTVDANADALERLRLGMAYEYDPRVVETLTRVVARWIETPT